MYPFNTFQICYRHIEDVHEEFICRFFVLFFLQIYSVFNLANLSPLYLMGNSAYFVKSTPPRSLSTWRVCYRHIVYVHEGS